MKQGDICRLIPGLRDRPDWRALFFPGTLRAFPEAATLGVPLEVVTPAEGLLKYVRVRDLRAEFKDQEYLVRQEALRIVY